MADYFSPTVIQQTIPIADITPLETVLLSRIFFCETDGDGLYFFAEERSADMISVGRAELIAALADPRSADSQMIAHVVGQLAKARPDAEEIDLDFSVESWEPIFQDIVRRSSTISHVTALTSFTCSKMRLDGFGGMATLITADAITGKSTEDILASLLDEAEHGPLAAAPGFGVHVLLRLAEADVRVEIARLLEADETLTPLAADAVSDVDIRFGCRDTAEQLDLSQEQRSAIFKAALAAIREAERRNAPTG